MSNLQPRKEVKNMPTCKAKNVKRIVENGSLTAADFVRSHVKNWLKEELEEV